MIKNSNLEILFLAIVISLANLPFSNSLWANQSGSKLVEKICQIDTYIQHSLKSKAVLPQELLIVVDVDGTLTDVANPNSIHSGVKARGSSVTMIDRLLADHVKVVISSAWHDFSATLHRLDEIGLGKNPGLKSTHENSYPDSINPRSAEISVTQDQAEHTAHSKISVEYARSGQVVSVRAQDELDHKYFSQKALAPYLVWSAAEMAQMRRVIVIEDSVRNINQFDSDIKKHNLFPNAKIEYFLLGSADVDPHPAQDLHSSENGHACNPTDADAIIPYQIETSSEEKFVLKAPPFKKKLPAPVQGSSL
jgi:hypothetical protein